jgi:hypothetical protein
MELHDTNVVSFENLAELHFKIILHCDFKILRTL